MPKTAGARPEISPELGRIVRQRRLLRGWSQQDLANRVGVSRATASHIELGLKRVTDPQVVKRLAEVLDITPDVVYAAQGVIPPDIVDSVSRMTAFQLQALREVLVEHV